MRLITRRAVYRAFPELDSFSDEQCRAFARAGRGVGWRLVRLRAAQGLALVGVLVAGLLVLWLVGRRTPLFDLRLSMPAWLLTGAAVAGLIMGSSALSMLLTRDLYLRRRMRWVIRTRGACMDCRYNLVGLIVSASGEVTCPECGQRLAVDRGLGEVQPDAGGVERFMPAPSLAGGRWWTPIRRRWALRVAVGVPLLFACLAASYEMFIRWQAGEAALARPGPAGMRTFVEAGQPAAADGVDAWKVLEGLERRRAELELTVWDRTLETPRGSRLYADMSFLRGRSGSGVEDPDLDPMTRRLLRDLIEAYRAGDLFGEATKLLGATRAVRPANFPASQPALLWAFAEYGALHQWAQLSLTRMRLAVEAGDVAEFEAAASVAVRLIWMARQGPLRLDLIAANNLEMFVIDELWLAMDRRPEPAWLDAVERAMAYGEPRGTSVRAIEGERLATLDTLCWVFESPGRARLGRFSEPFAGAGWWPAPRTYQRLGTFRENVRVMEAHFERVRAEAKLPPFQRVDDATLTHGLKLATMLLQPWRDTLDMTDAVNLYWEGLRLVVALERHRVRTGEYPQALEGLSGDGLGRVPVDPWSGGPLIYKRQPGGYVVYSVGQDGADDGGRGSRGVGRTYPVRQHMPGLDFVVGRRGGEAEGGQPGPR